MTTFAHELADRFDPPPVSRSPAVRYLHDPVGWVRDCIAWRDGESLTGYQNRILATLEERRRVAVRAPHGVGKTTDDALAVLWFATTRDAAGIDWKVVTTANVWRTLEKYLWPEIHKWAPRIRWERLGRAPFTAHELLDLNLKLRHGAASTVASDKPADIEGAHATHLLYLIDEAKTVLADTFDAIEGAFSGAGSDTAAEAYALATSTPGEPNGRFYEIHQRRAGYADWAAIHVTLDEAIAAGRISAEWAAARARQWGAESAVYANRVLGEFAASDEDGVIPLAWVEAANERWRDWQTIGFVPHRKCVGVDVARSGSAKTVIAPRHGNVILELKRYTKADTMATAGNVLAFTRAPGVYSVVDVIGLGAGVVDRLREQDQPVVAFNAAERTEMLDRSGELGFTNKRSAAWWNLRELLDPSNHEAVALPPDDQLTGDLTAPHWRVVSGGKIQVEAKADIEKRIGRSTDDGDAVVQAFWPEAPFVLPNYQLDRDRKVEAPVMAGVMTADF